MITLTFHNNPALVAEHDGTPEWLERVRDSVFEGLPPPRLYGERT